MKKKIALSLTFLLLAAGLAFIIWGLLGNTVGADSVTLVASERDTIASFLTFGGAMIGTAILFFVLLARTG